MTRPWRLAAVVAGAVVAVVAASCSHKNTLRPNIPPETYLFVRGPVDTVNHRVHLYWYGTDPDGDVVGFKARWTYSTGPANPPWQALPYVKPGVGTDSVLTVFSWNSR